MSTVLYNLLSLTMGLLVLAAPGLCMCNEKPEPQPQQQTHACCKQQKQQDSQSGQSKTCTHCGAQKVQPATDQTVHISHVLPVAWLSTEPVLDIRPSAFARVAYASLDPPADLTPVLSHTCSLT
jgi:hypothetical protein